VSEGEIDRTAASIVAFLRGIGLEVKTRAVAGPTFLPGITVERGVIVFDPVSLQHPGDLLHEAGHLAVKPPLERQSASANLGGDAAE